MFYIDELIPIQRMLKLFSLTMAYGIGVQTILPKEEGAKLYEN